MEVISLCPQLDSSITKGADRRELVRSCPSGLCSQTRLQSGRREPTSQMKIGKGWVSWRHAQASFMAPHSWPSPMESLPSSQWPGLWLPFSQDVLHNHSWPASSCPALALGKRRFFAGKGRHSVLLISKICLWDLLSMIPQCGLSLVFWLWQVLLKGIGRAFLLLLLTFSGVATSAPQNSKIPGCSLLFQSNDCYITSVMGWRLPPSLAKEMQAAKEDPWGFFYREPSPREFRDLQGDGSFSRISLHMLAS